MAIVSLNAHSSALVDVHPNEALADRADLTPRVATGLAGLDRLLGGGLPPGRTTVVSGRTGTGKTTLALQFLADGVAMGQRGLIAVVDEKPRHIMEDAKALGWDLQAWIAAKSLRLLDGSPYFAALAKPHRAPSAREIAADVAGQIKGFGARRLVIDPVTSLVRHDQSPAEVREFLRTFIFTLEDNLGVTTMLVAPRTEGGLCAASIAEQLASGVIELSLHECGGRLQRVLRLTKMRGTRAEPCEFEVRIVGGKGLVEGGVEEKAPMPRAVESNARL